MISAYLMIAVTVTTTTVACTAVLFDLARTARRTA